MKKKHRSESSKKFSDQETALSRRQLLQAGLGIGSSIALSGLSGCAGGPDSGSPELKPGIGNIDHMVVVMLENHSFDNMVGWLYGPDNLPARNIPSQSPPTYDGLLPDTYWNQASKVNPEVRVYASEGTTGSSDAFFRPNPDPQEQFSHMTSQIFWPEKPDEEDESPDPTMQGFVLDYQTVKGNSKSNANSIMWSYSPNQVSVLSGLARNYAICDQWFASCPTQTWPNRSFVHAGTSFGHVNNFPYDPLQYRGTTIYKVLKENKQSWGIYCDETIGDIPVSHTALVMSELWDPLLTAGHLHTMDTFKQQAQDGTLPKYSFLEPGWLKSLNSGHPPLNVCCGERFLLDIWNAVSTGNNWERTLLVIMYDEHGGCYDHVPTPWGAATPDEKSDPGKEGFYFKRFGVRVPTVLVSPFIEPGTVFRQPKGETPYDHTSILATLRDWLNLDMGKLKSQRVANAPNVDSVLTRTMPRKDIPTIAQSMPCTKETHCLTPGLALSDLQKSIVGAVARHREGDGPIRRVLDKVFAKVRTTEDAIKYLAEGDWPPGFTQKGS